MDKNLAKNGKIDHLRILRPHYLQLGEKDFCRLSNSGPPERLLGGHKHFSITNEVTDMKFICFGFHDETSMAEMSESERNSFIERCFSYDDELRRNGHFLGGEALQPAGNAATVRYRSGQVIVTDGPYAETKEQIGGFLFLEARDMNHAIPLMARHPGVRAGGIEIRAANEEINALIAARTAKAALAKL